MSLEFFTLSSSDPRKQLGRMGRTPKETAQALATSLTGGTPRHLGYGSLRAVLAKPSSTQLAVAVNGDCLFVVAIDLPGRSLRWGDLIDQHADVARTEACMVGTYPASDGFEFEWRSPDVERCMRHGHQPFRAARILIGL